MGKGHFTYLILIMVNLCLDISFTKKLAVWKSVTAYFGIIRNS